MYRHLLTVLAMAAACWAEDHGHGPQHQGHRHHPDPDRPRTEIEASPDYWSGLHLSGDWGGARSRLEEKGLTLAFIYTGEGFSNTRGGGNTQGALEYLGALEVTAELDVEKMGGWKGGRFYLYYMHLHGSGVSEHAGAFQAVSYLEADPKRYDRLMEYWYLQEFLDGKLAFKAGKFDGNADFAATENGGYFIQASAGFYPTLNFPSYPDNGLGFAVFGKPAEFLTLQAAVMDGVPNGDSISGGPSFLSRMGGHVGLFEAQLHTASFSPLPGTFRLGGWHHTGDWEELAFFPEDEPDPPDLRTYASNSGLYATFDQLLFKERPKDEDDAQGLSAFFQFGWAPEDRNEVHRYFGGGLTYTGLFPTRDEDVFGVFVGHADFSKRLRRSAGLTHETVVEVTYGIQVTPFIHLQPDYQWIRHPGGDPDARDAHVAGLRWTIDF